MARKGRPPYNADYILNERQINCIVATLITDGWIELQRGAINPRIGLQQCEANRSLVEYWRDILDPIIGNRDLQLRNRTAPNGTRSFPQYMLRTANHPQLQQFITPFGGTGRNKTIPTLSYLMEHLSWESLAIMIMMDGSRHNEGQAIELHLQGFPGDRPQGRLCHALYRKFGLKAWPARYGLSNSGEVQYHIMISGSCLELIRTNCLPHILPAFKYKIPAMGSRGNINQAQSPWLNWYESTKNEPWLESLD